MPKFTTEQIKAELKTLTGFRIAKFYLKAELARRQNAGRKSTGKAMTVNERVKKFRAKPKD